VQQSRERSFWSAGLTEISPKLRRALGAKPESLLPHGKWPDRVYDWVILLSFDLDGRLIPSSSRQMNEHLMPGDS
jgi:hypothetical protein